MRGYHLRIVVSNTTIQEQQTVPAEVFDRLPSHSPRQTTRRNATVNFDKKDYRFGPLRIDWADFDIMEPSTSPKSSFGKRRESGQGHAAAKFVPIREHESGSTNIPEGVVHVFRDSVDLPPEDLVYDKSLPSSSSKTVVLGVLAVPAWMTPSDFLSFSAPAAEGISHIRIIRDSLPNRSIALVEFPRQEDAAEFIEAYNGKPFNSLESEICNIVRIRSVKILTQDSAHQAFSPTNDGSMYELPTCPVCLERMDSAVTGLITVPCSHTFHCSCLSKWGDSRCPVCRYSQSLKSSHPASSSSTRSAASIPFSNSSSLTTCATCSSPNNLWICLICGNVGCGRYGRAHAQQHYQLTTHLYALELETQRVWDYAGDGYVHRLIQNRADGKLVELPSAASSMGPSSRDGGAGPSPADALTAEKIEAIGIEYSYLLTSQLDSQRSYYEEQATGLEGQVLELKGVVDRLTHDLDEQKALTKSLEEQRHRGEEEEIDEAVKQKLKAETKAERMAQTARQLDKELKEERAVTAGLMKNLAIAKEKIDDSEKVQQEWTARIKDLEDQLRDVMFFLEANAKIEHGGGAASEAAGGSIELPPTSPTHSERKKKGKKP